MFRKHRVKHPDCHKSGQFTDLWKTVHENGAFLHEIPDFGSREGQSGAVTDPDWHAKDPFRRLIPARQYKLLPGRFGAGIRHGNTIGPCNSAKHSLCVSCRRMVNYTGRITAFLGIIASRNQCVRQKRYNGARYEPGLFQGKSTPRSSPGNPFSLLAPPPSSLPIEAQLPA